MTLTDAEAVNDLRYLAAQYGSPEIPAAQAMLRGADAIEAQARLRELLAEALNYHEKRAGIGYWTVWEAHARAALTDAKGGE